ncbi:FecR family protein, partial [Salinivirga cyanobacteriivorans]
MNDKNQHSDRHSQFFERTDIPYSRSKEDVWEAMMNQQKPEIKQAGQKRKMLVYWSAAAMVIVLLGLTSFMRFYSVTLHAPRGQHLSKLLPDSTRVHLNAQTQITYHPYWWRFGRIVELKGEAYFEVRKGSKFTVNSEMGSTTVLGTRFNIFARNKQYRVQCISGQVEVKDNTGQKQILKP